MITLTKAQFIALRPCNPEKRLALWGDAESLNVEQALTRGYSVRDILWVAGKVGLKRQCVIFAIRCARLVLHFNPDPRVKAGIDAAQTWLDNPCPAASMAAFAAADAAARAADAADAADATAARAADAGADAAFAAANAGADAIYAADAARAAARAAYAANAAADANDAIIRAILIAVFSQQSVD